MSLAIDVDNVARVLLADGWHTVHQKGKVSTFTLDSYEYIWEGETMHGGGRSGVCSTGFTFKDQDTALWVSGPLTAILAVAERQSE